MRKMKSILLVALSLLMIASAFTIAASASSAYQTYTYSIDGKALYSPDAYSAVQTINSAAMNGVGPNTTVKAINPAIVDTALYATIILGVLGIGGCIIFRKKH